MDLHGLVRKSQNVKCQILVTIYKVSKLQFIGKSYNLSYQHEQKVSIGSYNIRQTNHTHTCLYVPVKPNKSSHI